MLANPHVCSSETAPIEGSLKFGRVRAVPEWTSSERRTRMPVSFARDIKPMFRQIDIEHMKRFKVLLDDYTYMSDPSNDHSNAQDVEDRLVKKSMPPGGPYWSDQQLAIYRQWSSDGYQP